MISEVPRYYPQAINRMLAVADLSPTHPPTFAGATGRITSLVSGKAKVLAGRIKHALEHDYPMDSLSKWKEEKAPW